MSDKKSIFVVSDLLWRDSFTSHHSPHYSWHILTKIPFHQGPPWSVYSLTRFSPFQLLCMAACFITNGLIAVRPRYVPFFPSRAKLHCEICQLTLAQPCLTTSQSIFIQANFTHALTLVPSFCLRYKRFETQTGETQQGAVVILRCWLTGTHPLQTEQDVIKDTRCINYRLSRCLVFLLQPLAVCIYSSIIVRNIVELYTLFKKYSNKSSMLYM